MYACLCLNIPGTARSSATCLAMVPLTLKKKFILWSTTDGWETPPARVCLQKGRVAVNALLALSLSTFQPIILQGEGALSVIALKPTQPLMLSHASSCGSLVILIPVCFSFFHNFTQQIFFFPKQSPRLFSNVWTSCILTENGRTSPQQKTFHRCSTESQKLTSRDTHGSTKFIVCKVYFCGECHGPKSCHLCCALTWAFTSCSDIVLNQTNTWWLLTMANVTSGFFLLTLPTCLKPDGEESTRL